MSDELAAFAIGIVVSAGVLLGCCSDVPAHDMRRGDCNALCAKAGVLTAAPSMCVCRNGKTYQGKRPEFYLKAGN